MVGCSPIRSRAKEITVLKAEERVVSQPGPETRSLGAMKFSRRSNGGGHGTRFVPVTPRIRIKGTRAYNRKKRGWRDRETGESTVERKIRRIKKRAFELEGEQVLGIRRLCALILNKERIRRKSGPRPSGKQKVTAARPVDIPKRSNASDGGKPLEDKDALLPVEDLRLFCPCNRAPREIIISRRTSSIFRPYRDHRCQLHI